MNKFSTVLVVGVAVLIVPLSARAQQRAPQAEGTVSTVAEQNVPPAAQRAEGGVERAVRRFRLGLQGGVGLDPEILDVGVHALFGPIFTPNVEFRPVVEVGVGEVTTLFGFVRWFARARRCTSRCSP